MTCLVEGSQRPRLSSRTIATPPASARTPVACTAAALIGLGLLASPRPAEAADVGRPPPPAVAPLLDWEVRVGGYAHNPFFRRENGSVDLTLEIRTPKLTTWGNPWLDFLTPRVYAGTTINFRGFTTLGYAGFAWNLDLTDRIFIDAGVGAAFHDGNTSAARIPNGRLAELGCSPLIHTSSSLGYRLTDNWSVMATIEHVSNGGICGRNQGLTHVGGRIAYRF